MPFSPMKTPETNRCTSCALRLGWLVNLGGAFGGAVESRAPEEKVDLLPGFATGFF